MQYRGFIQFALLLLASGCLVFGLSITLFVLVVCSLMIEFTAWSKVLEPQHSSV